MKTVAYIMIFLFLSGCVVIPPIDYHQPVVTPEVTTVQVKESDDERINRLIAEYVDNKPIPAPVKTELPVINVKVDAPIIDLKKLAKELGPLIQVPMIPSRESNDKFVSKKCELPSIRKLLLIELVDKKSYADNNDYVGYGKALAVRDRQLTETVKSLEREYLECQ